MDSYAAPYKCLLFTVCRFSGCSWINICEKELLTGTPAGICNYSEDFSNTEALSCIILSRELCILRTRRDCFEYIFWIHTASSNCVFHHLEESTGECGCYFANFTSSKHIFWICMIRLLLCILWSDSTSGVDIMLYILKDIYCSSLICSLNGNT